MFLILRYWRINSDNPRIFVLRMRTSLLPSIKTNTADDGLSYLDDIKSLEILEIIERRKRSMHPGRANDLDCTDKVAFRSRYRLNKDTAKSLIQMLDDTLSAPS
ncbi:hypothetical protein AVEN_162207-1 [Araneus ventricosus]|uniref:Uncharacterized protein n=1 Tax=Araneus ventricosus TaxID=182803 RepID=A0A4Y2FHM3_ARAVE|nr:hypothetical protein AVEN_162207-1 [Araneus ventricosus]